ncbi:transcription termination/antitermination NusG family protein [Advenella sp. EE-W14]|uniref:transcription termination/antitermination NusG family protein n=1 Tax=Advenella sp. EE-W14 TaxID=2722705 RepID=UPI00145DA6C2|nr:transcription termination/antitermination NusG family protein [Advenella sp. EE-W14]
MRQPKHLTPDAPSPDPAQPACDTAGFPWYVAYTKPRQEECALTNLLQQDFNVYLPRYKKLKKPAKNAICQEMQVVHEPMFPRYIFLQRTRPEQAISKAQHTRGIVTLVRFGVELAIMPAELIAAIQEYEQHRNQAGFEEISPLKPGTRVKLNHNTPLQGLEGLVQTASAKRVIVLLEILGRPKTIKLEPNQLDIT